MSDEPIELVLLHPLPFDGDVWSSFEAGFCDTTTYAPTLYALGETLEDVAHSLLDLIEGSRLVVVGNSIGGSCALELAAAAPERIEHLVLVGTKAGHRPEPDYRDWALNLLDSAGPGALWTQVWEPLFSPATARSVVERSKAKALAMPVDQLAAGINLFHTRRDLTHVVDRWPKPLTAVAGGHDTAPRPQQSEDVVRRARRGALRVVPDSGHYVPIERPDVLMSILSDAVESPA